MARRTHVFGRFIFACMVYIAEVRLTFGEKCHGEVCFYGTNRLCHGSNCTCAPGFGDLRTSTQDSSRFQYCLQNCRSFLDCEKLNTQCVAASPGYPKRCECREGFRRMADGNCFGKMCGVHICGYGTNATCVGSDCACAPGFGDQRTFEGPAASIQYCLKTCQRDENCPELNTQCRPSVSPSTGRRQGLCECKEGFERTTKGNCVDIDECKVPGVCGNERVCVNRAGNFSCHCYPGYHFSPHTNECVDGKQHDDPEEDINRSGRKVDGPVKDGSDKKLDDPVKDDSEGKLDDPVKDSSEGKLDGAMTVIIGVGVGVPAAVIVVSVVAAVCIVRHKRSKKMERHDGPMSSTDSLSSENYFSQEETSADGNQFYVNSARKDIGGTDIRETRVSDSGDIIRPEHSNGIQHCFPITHGVHIARNVNDECTTNTPHYLNMTTKDTISKIRDEVYSTPYIHPLGNDHVTMSGDSPREAGSLPSRTGTAGYGYMNHLMENAPGTVNPKPCLYSTPYAPGYLYQSERIPV